MPSLALLRTSTSYGSRTSSIRWFSKYNCQSANYHACFVTWWMEPCTVLYTELSFLSARCEAKIVFIDVHMSRSWSKWMWTLGWSITLMMLWAWKVYLYLELDASVCTFWARSWTLLSLVQVSSSRVSTSSRSKQHSSAPAGRQQKKYFLEEVWLCPFGPQSEVTTSILRRITANQAFVPCSQRHSS